MEKSVKEKLEKGAVMARVIQEVLGKPKDHVDQAIATVIKAIKEQEGVETLSVKVFPAEEKEDGVFIAFAEMDLLFKDLPRLIGYCFDFTPASIEVAEPSSFNFNVAYLNDLMNDLIVKLHAVSMNAQTLKLQNDVLRKKGTMLLRNMVILAVGKNERNMDEISKIVGIPSEQLKAYIDVLVKEKKLVKKGEMYSLPK